MSALPAAFLDRPIAHRALHGPGRPENSLSAVRAAVARGYGIEIDVQPSADGQAMVFHDADLARLTGKAERIAAVRSEDLRQTRLFGSDEGIPTLWEVLEAVAGQVPLLVEIKDQDGRLGPNLGPLEGSVARAMAGYQGPAAVMSFNPHSVAEIARLAPDLPRGLTTCAFTKAAWPSVGAATRRELSEIRDFERVGAVFISHAIQDLDMLRVAELKAEGVPVLSWTITSAAQEALALKVADNITFEGYAARIGSA
ncbi:MAG: glycerophosphodiester phosphodiesterase family protein [Pseudomonadota bacterium]